MYMPYLLSYKTRNNPTLCELFYGHKIYIYSAIINYRAGGQAGT